MRVFISAVSIGLTLFFVGSVSAQPVAPAPSSGEAEAEAKVEGIEIVRPGGGYLGVQTQGLVLRVTFYDDKKKPVAADAVRISARWRDPKQNNTVLLPVAPETMASPGLFKKPFSYQVYLTVVGANDVVIESHILRLVGSDG